MPGAMVLSGLAPAPLGRHVMAMTRLILPFLVVIAVLLGVPASHADPMSLRAAGQSRVVEVVDGDTVVLADGKEVRLVGMQAPKLPLGRPNFDKWPLADESKAALESLVLKRKVELRQGGTPGDRHGRVLAHLVRDDGLWIQGEMLRLGMARVYTFPDNRAIVPDMLAKEREARSAARGIWSHPYYAIRHHRTADRFIGSFQLVEGTVFRADRVGKRIYLNFEEDWRRDFTISIDNQALKMFDKAGLDPLRLEGNSVRVRGWLRERNGAMIEATHPEQIEMLER